MANRVTINTDQLESISELAAGYHADLRITEVGNGAVRVAIIERDENGNTVYGAREYVILHTGAPRG